MVRQYCNRAIALRDGEVMFNGAIAKLDDEMLKVINRSYTGKTHEGGFRFMETALSTFV
ncbi:MAG: hypothetical protein RM347_032590 [Nostoc sp. ChiQUE02]|uniref:hypothetical protein n=1 Tax=Nostoc sp. ChiQUE02 TaxID=3075377 RepID=UPI002AD5AF15|nr:hypothetical protein [Nostoc sp. ChiQUE02]MDZ8234402.1 hypothetical protein [Nostoc sp. ChiQUE02]